MPTTLSYSTMRELLAEPHTYLCKQMGLERFTTRQMNEGKEAHRVIQDHVGGLKADDRLAAVKCRFSTVEQCDQDKATHFAIPITNDYFVHGYLDGLDDDRFLEIKTSSSPWSMGQFARLIQWRIYALSNPNFKTVWFITCTRDLRRVAVYKQDVTQKDRDIAVDWIMGAIKIIESGDFEYKGVGHSRACPYIHCPFCGEMLER